MATKKSMERKAIRLEELRDLKKTIEAEIDDLTAQFREALDVGSHVYGDHIITLSNRNTFNEAKAKEVLSVVDLKKITVPKIDSAKAKQVLAPEVYRSCTVPGANPTVTVKEVD